MTAVRVAIRLLGAVLLLLSLAAVPASAKKQSLPPPVTVRPEPEGVMLGDPAFTPVPGAHADFGRLGGAVYQIEMPRHWNGRLVLWIHGFEDFAPEAQVSAPDFRRYLIGQHYAWGASSFSSTSLIPGRAADETAALWDYFARKYGRPTRTYVTGLSMGGAASHIAAERYPDRFDGALALSGNVGNTAGLRFGDAEASGCGAPGARIVLWTFAQNQILFSRESVTWPGNRGTSTFNASFSTSAPNGAAPATSSFVGEVIYRDGRQLPPGTLVEAFVGRTRCGVSSVRRTGNFSGYTMAVVGPDSIPGCRGGATLFFRVGGQLAIETAVNEPNGRTDLDLTLRRKAPRCPRNQTDHSSCRPPNREG